MSARLHRSWILVAFFIAGATVRGNTAVLVFSDARPGQVELAGNFGPNMPPSIFIPVPAPMPAAAVRDLALQFIQDNTSLQVAALDPVSLVIKDLAPHANVILRAGTTAARNGVMAAGATRGDIGFTGTFQPFDAAHQPAVFTAGIVTDVGELTEAVSAADLNFQTDGPIICQALFQRLAPRAPQYGAQINYAGDRLEIYFDPAYSIGPTGVKGGTTSPSPGSSNDIEIPAPTPPDRAIWTFSNSLDGMWGMSGPMLPGTPLPPVFSIPMPGSMTGAEKRASVMQWFQNNTSLPVVPLGAAAIGLNGLPPGVPLSARVANSATVDRLMRAFAATASIRFSAPIFDPIGGDGLPAVFTAGIVTDVGELIAEVSAEELNFQTEAPIICQALFQRLAPRAPQLGGLINFAGDRLEVYFDPAYVFVRGGAVVGSTSRTPGAIVEVDAGPWPRAGSGDVNGDGRANGDDIQPMLDALQSSQSFYGRHPTGDLVAADLNGDGQINDLDIAPAVSVLTGANR